MKAIGAILTGLVLAACSPLQSPIRSSTGELMPELTTAPTPRGTERAPAEPESARDLLECEGPASSMGGRADDFGPTEGGTTPEEAFEAFVHYGLFSIPQSGYVRLGEVGDRTVYTYEVDGRTKVVIVVSPRFADLVRAPYTIEEVRSCDPSEYGEGVDLGIDERAWANAETGEILIDIVGPQHCGWQSARILHVNHPDGSFWKQYLRDPGGVFEDAQLLESYAEDAALPDDATDSGYRSPEGYELWFTESDTAAYVVTPDGVERWPRAAEGIGCA